MFYYQVLAVFITINSAVTRTKKQIKMIAIAILNLLCNRSILDWKSSSYI